MRKIKHALILAGGDSTRLWPLEHKCLISFMGKPLIQHVVEGLSPYVEKFVIVSHKESRPVIEKLNLPSTTVVVQDALHQGMGGAIMSVKGIRGETLVVNGADILDFRVLETLIESVSRRKLRYAFVARKVDSYFPGGYLKLQNGKAIGVVEKPSPEKIPSPFVKLVVDYFSEINELIQILEKTVKQRTDDWFEQALTQILIDQGGVDFIPYQDYWHSIKYPWHILPMMRHFLSGLTTINKISPPSIAGTAILRGPVYLGKNVTIGDYAKIVGPCYVDDNVVVGDYALVRESQIGEGSLIGGYSEVARSFIGCRVSLHRDYVGDSILDADVLMGAGTVTANFRFDAQTVFSDMRKLGAVIGKKSKIGVQSTLLPGVKIGKHTFIGPGSTITKDVNDNQFVFEGVTKPNRHIA